MDYIQGTPRVQSLLFPEIIDDYITEDNPIRFIGDLLKLYIYGYLNRIRSSRRLEKEACRDVELMWLLRKLTPDFKTIADFRKDNHKAFKHVFRQFTLLCRELELFGGELLAIDGTKFKAVNSKHSNFTKAKLTKRLKEMDAKIEQYAKKRQ